MNDLDELAETVLGLLRLGDATTLHMAQVDADVGIVAVQDGGCLHDLIDLRPWQPRSMHEWLT